MFAITSTTQPNKEKNLCEKIREHKTGLIITSTIICTAFAGLLIYKRISCNELLQIKESALHALDTNKKIPILETDSLQQLNTVHLPNAENIFVLGYPRNLPHGYKASQKQLEIAKELGITLAENQTYVTDYSRKAA